ncbi:MAG: branched-chain amino acid aminotransferase [Asgard group archaeon]|nr:branched-chain amino acid aminotransferase [Asgard group archaeon]
MAIEIQLCTKEQRKKKLADSELVFGKKFTDHMFLMKYKNNEWGTPRIVPYQSFQLDPACAVLHYSQEIFEGMKAFPHPDGSVNLFRPFENAARFNLSAERMCMPQVNEDLFVKAIVELIRVDKDWVPHSSQTALYIRPTMIATEKFLGLRASSEFYFYVILSPVGPFFKEGFKPTKAYVASQNVRATPDGTGEAKTGGNYAATLHETCIAKNKGYPQVIWLDAIHRKFVEEASGMNIMFIIEDEIYTPPLEGTILKGITRKSVLELAQELGYTVHEEKIEINEIVDQIDKGQCTEAFFVGTAASITPIGQILYNDREYIINNLNVGKITQNLYDKLVGIQTGKIDDKFNWTYRVD